MIKEVLGVVLVARTVVVVGVVLGLWPLGRCESCVDCNLRPSPILAASIPFSGYVD